MRKLADELARVKDVNAALMDFMNVLLESDNQVLDRLMAVIPALRAALRARRVVASPDCAGMWPCMLLRKAFIFRRRGQQSSSVHSMVFGCRRRRGHRCLQGARVR